jgi:YVTN family beta-propeller protein
VIDTIPVTGTAAQTYDGLQGVAYDPANGDIYVLDNPDPFDNGTVSVIDPNTNTNTVTSTIPLLHQPKSVAFDPSNGDLYVTQTTSDRAPRKRWPRP